MPRRFQLLLTIATVFTLFGTAALHSGFAVPSASALCAQHHADTLQTLQPEDLFRLHRIGDVRFSPDGNQLAYEVMRPGAEGATKHLSSHIEARSDIWVVPEEEADPQPLTRGASDGTGWFHPRWSPDGERLAFLSVDGNEVRAWIWQRGADEPRQLTDRPVHLVSSIPGPLLLQWVSERELALAVRPEGASEHGQLLSEDIRPGIFSMEAWETSWSGQEVTVDVFDGGAKAKDENHLSRTELAIFDMEGTSQITASGRWGITVPSPDGEWATTLANPPVGAIEPDELVRQQMIVGTQLGVVPLHETGEDASGDDDLLDSPDNPLPTTIRWAPDGSAFALLTQPSGGEGPPSTRVAVYHLGDDQAQFVDDPSLRFEQIAWTGHGQLLVRARQVDETGEAESSHWWQPPLGDVNEWTNLTAGMESVPGDLAPVPEGAVGVADGTLWQLDADRFEQVLEGPAELQDLVGRAPVLGVGPASPRERSPEDPLRVLVGSGGDRELWTVQIDEGEAREIRRLSMPERAETPADVTPRGDAAAFSSSDETGTWLWQSDAPTAESADEAFTTTPDESSADLDTLFAEDQWLEDIDGAEIRQLTYAGPQGDDLIAWILLPPGRDTGEVHPTVTSIYPGRVHGEQEPRSSQLNIISGISALQLLASHGYAVLLPSVPLDTDDDDARPDLAETVIPAVDRAVEEGYTDSSRVGVMGHSYGGFGVNHLISQTDRFDAAVSSASIAHLRSSYGTFDARSRYGHLMHPLTAQLTMKMGYFESGQGQMGAPPAMAPERYREASPLTYVDDVSTPLMLLHGDQDYMAVQQAEMFFSELHRLGKPVRLVRYAGEGHIISGRANVLDMWERILGWFDKYLGDPQAGSN